MPNKSTSDNLPCVGKLKENGLLPVADETETGEVTSSKHLLEYPSTLYAENSGSREKLSEKPLPFSGALNLSSCQEGLTKREGNPDSEAKDPGHCEGFCHLQPKSSNEEHPSNYDHKGGTDVESEVVHFRELQSAQCHTVQVNPNQSAAWESVTQPSSSSTSVSQSSGAETLLNECGGPTFLRDEERAAFQHQIHELQEQVNQLEEQLKKSGTEKQQLQAELGRCLFLEDKGRRNQKLQLLSRESGSDQSRSCAGSASSTLTSMDGRLLGGAGPLQEPSKSTFFTRDASRADRVKFSVGYLFFSFIVASNLHINLCIKLCSLLEGIYYPDCLQQKRPNQNPLSARMSRGRGPTHPYLCDVETNNHLKGCFRSMAATCMNLRLICCFSEKKNKPFPTGYSK